MTDDGTIHQLKAMVVEGAKISWEIPHARERAAERDVPIFEAERIIHNPGCCQRQLEQNEERWRVSGFDSDVRPVDVVVKPIGRTVLRVITVIRTDE